MAFRIVRQVTFRGELRERTIEHDGDVLQIGRGTSNELHLEDLAVSLNHATISRDSQGRWVLRDLTGAGTTYLNQAPIKESVLRNGDTIRIQRYTVEVTQPDSSGPLVLTVHEQPREQDEPSLALLPKLQLQGGRWSRKGLAALLTAVVVAGVLLAIGVGKHGVFMPGAVSLKHAKFAEQCDKCHDSWKAVWHLVPDKSCQTCHPATLLTPSHFGDRTLTPAPQCASCHLEHKGQTFLAAVPDGQCVQCHGALNAKDPLLPVVTAIHSFTRDHPEFAISRTLSDKKTPTRVRFDDKTLLKDDGRLKLNHEVHLAPDLPTSNGRETLSCASCHRTETDGRYMQPIKYERDCMRCHTLEFDPQLPGKSVTHGRQPIEVRRELQEIYSTLYLRNNPEEVKPSAGTKRLPGQPPTPQETFVEDRRARAERILFSGAGKRCIKCHVVEEGGGAEGAQGEARAPSVGGGGPVKATETPRQSEVPMTKGLPGRARDTFGGREKSEDFRLGQLDNLEAKQVTGAGLFRVRAVNVPDRWLPYSRFDHTAHFGLADIKKKGNVCLACHEQASTSRRTEDVLLPAIGLCRTCHMEPGGAQAGCRACHDFHPKRPDTGPPRKDSAIKPAGERLSALVRPVP